MHTAGDNAVEQNAGGSYLGGFYDADLEAPADLSAEVITGDEIGRLSSALAIVLVATSLPRRLGGDASDADLALDKRRGRRVGHALSQSLRSWAGKLPTLEMTNDVRKTGAQLDWARFREEHATQVMTRLRLIATWGIRSGNQDYAKSACVRLQNELSWVEYALRD